MGLAVTFPHFLKPPSAGGYALALTGPLFVGVALYRLLVVYYESALRDSVMTDFLPIAVDFLRYRHRGWLLLSVLGVFGVGYGLAQLIVPESAGSAAFSSKYSFVLQTAAGAIVAVLILLAVQTRLASRQKRFAIRGPGMIAVLATMLGEVAAIAALSPGLPGKWQELVFSVMVAGAGTGLAAILFIAFGGVGEEG